MQVEISQHTELEGGVRRPIRVRLGDGDDVDGVEEKLHAEEGEEEADAVQSGSADGQRWGGVGGLRDVVVEGEDGTSEIER